MTTTTSLTPVELHRTITTMSQFGGHFCAKLAEAWFAGDRDNRRRIEDAFQHLLTCYGPGSIFYHKANI